MPKNDTTMLLPLVEEFYSLFDIGGNISVIGPSVPVLLFISSLKYHWILWRSLVDCHCYTRVVLRSREVEIRPFLFICEVYVKVNS